MEDLSDGIFSVLRQPNSIAVVMVFIAVSLVSGFMFRRNSGFSGVIYGCIGGIVTGIISYPLSLKIVELVTQ